MSYQGTGGPRRQGNPRGAVGGCLFLVLFLGVLVVIATTHDHGHDSATSASSTSADPYAPASDDPATDDPATDSADDAIEAGDCLSVDGDIPTDSTATVDVSNITKVDCSSSDAQYKVVGVVPLSTDMSSCATDYPSSTVSLLDQGPYFSFVYCAVDNG